MNEVDIIVPKMIKCPRCGSTKEAHHIDTHICVDCAKAENVRYSHHRMNQTDWLDAAKEAGIDAWLQQPGETQWEYTIWSTYRDCYPGKRPSYAMVAAQLLTTYNVVKKSAQRWSFPIRMQLWMANCDQMTMLQRRREILDMNSDHISMATKLRTKLNTAIDALIPEMMKPSDITALAKLAAEMERTAHIDTLSQEALVSTSLADTENPDLKKGKTNQTDLAEVVAILMKSGVISDVAKVGVRQTTEVALVDKDGATTTMKLGE